MSHQLACVVVVEEVGGVEVVGCVTVDVELEAVDEVDEAHDAITIESARTKVMAVRMTFSFIFLLGCIWFMDFLLRTSRKLPFQNNRA